MSSDEAAETPSHLNCLDIFNRFSYCSSPRIQFSYFSAHGEFEDCSVFFSDWIKCLNYKLTSDQKKKVLIRKSMYMENRVKPVNDIWTYKKTPSWTEDETPN